MYLSLFRFFNNVMKDPLEAVEKQLQSFRRIIDFESQLMPEALHGLVALYSGEEDITCFTLKRFYGKREKGASQRVF